MTELVAALRLYPTFQSLPQPEVEATGHLWRPVHLDPGATLWSQEEVSTGLAVVLRGEVQVTVDGTELGRIGNGGIVGEVSAFFAGSKRSGTVSSTEGADLAALSGEELSELRANHPGVYGVLLDQALRALVRRVRAADRRITSLSKGAMPAPARVEPGALARVWRRLVPGTPKTACPPVLPILRRQPTLAEVPDDVLAAIGARFVPEAYAEGQVVFLEGDDGGSAWIIADGGVEILRHVRAERAERIAQLGPGDLIGINSVVEASGRTASGVTSKPTWVWKITADALRQLPTVASIPWRECMLAALGTQLRLAHRSLARVSTGSPADATFGEDFDRLLHAQGYLEGLPVAAREPFSVRASRGR